MTNTIVIGSGIIGSATAYHLVNEDVETLLIDRGDRGQATRAGAGVLSPTTSGQNSDAWYDLAREAVSYYPTLVKELKAAGIDQTSYERCGNLVVDHPDFENSSFVTRREKIFARQERKSDSHASRVYEISPEEAETLCPLLGDIRAAIYYEDGARVDGKLFKDALLESADKNGLETLNASADRITRSNGEATGIVANGEQYPASNIVIAGGAWSGEFENQLMIEIPVEPQRGQLIHLKLHERNPREWPVVVTAQSNYFTPWDNEKIVVGSTFETGAGYTPHTTADGVRNVLAETLRIFPELSDSEVVDIKAGLRPLSADGLPIIGEAPSLQGVYLATGHGSTGLQLGPYTGKLIADRILKRQLEIDLSSFEPDRFI